MSKKKDKTLPTDVKLCDFEFLQTVGKGTFGRVRIARYRPTGAVYAIKIVFKDVVVKLRQVEHILQERVILIHVNHCYIVNLEATFEDDLRLYMVFEYVPGGELFYHLRKMGRFDIETSRFYAAELVLALEYLHSKKIVYRDLKPENILLDRNGHMKLTDFGFAKVIRDATYTVCGTPDYMSPEVISQSGHSFATDWWGVGVLIFEMLAGYPPFYDEDPYQTYQKIMSGKIMFPRHFDEVTRDLISGLLTINKAQRLGSGGKTAVEVIKRHPFFQFIDWNAIKKRMIKPPINPIVKDDFDSSNFEKYEETDIHGSQMYDSGQSISYTPSQLNKIFQDFNDNSF